MKKKTKIALILFTTVLLIIEKVRAHSEKTDKYGCHTCKTNCSAWGLQYNEYHCHNGNSNRNSTNSGNTSFSSETNFFEVVKSSDTSISSITIDNYVLLYIMKCIFLLRIQYQPFH